MIDAIDANAGSPIVFPPRYHAVLKYAGRDVTFMDCDPQDFIQAELLAGRWYELEMLEYMRGLRAEGTYLDVGAYVGTFSVFAALFCPASRVIAIEPQRDIYEKMDANIRDNCCHVLSEWQTYRIAIGDQPGSGRLVRSETNQGGAWLKPGSAVKVVTLDSLNLPPPAVVKIDVENSELAVLRGGRRTISQAEHLFVEYWPEKTCQEYGIPYTGQQVADLLHEMGFLHQREFAGDQHHWAKASKP